MSLADDQTIVAAVSNLPSLALPPIGGVLVLLFGYIVLVGPVNYLVLRRFDKREWAWFTVPALIVVFTAGSFAIGGLLRGTEVIVHEVAIVRGAPGTDSAVAQSYLGVFSPTRGAYQVRVPGDALLSAPMNGDFFGGGTAATLDVLQGDPSRVRDLAVGVGSIRTIRAEASAIGPNVTADLRLADGHVKGTLTNHSDKTLESAALVVGSSAVRLKDIAAGSSVDVDLPVNDDPFNGIQLSERIFGPQNWDGSPMDEAEQRTMVRRSVVDQLSVDPMTGVANAIPSDTATLMAWGVDPVVPIEIEGQRVRRVANILYDVPLPYSVSGNATFAGDLLRSSVIEVGANFFSKDPWAYNMGPGTTRVSYRPIPFDGTLTPSKVVIGLTFGGDVSLPAGAGRELKETTRCEPGTDGCVVPADGLPDIEVLDVGTGEWVQFEHMLQGVALRAQGPGALPRSRVRRAPGPLRERAPGPGELPVPDPHLRDRPVTGIVRATGLVKRYDKTLAVGGLDLDVAQGEIFGLVGPNGAGKTTTLRILATLLVPDAGDAEIAGASVRRNPNDVRRVLGFMPDSFGVYDDMKVWEYLDFFARCYGIPAERRRRMIGDLLELVDLGPKRDVYVQGLSRGMQQRLCLAHTLVHDPQVLLLDEPASGLDPRARVELRELLRELRSLGKTHRRQHPHPPRARGAVHLGRDHRPRPGARPGPGRGHREAPAAWARSCAPGCWATTRTTRPPGPGSRASRTSSRRSCSPTAPSRSASTATTMARPCCWPSGRRGPAGRLVRPGRERPRGAVPPGHVRATRSPQAVPA